MARTKIPRPITTPSTNAKPTQDPWDVEFQEILTTHGPVATVTRIYPHTVHRGFVANTECRPLLRRYTRFDELEEHIAFLARHRSERLMQRDEHFLAEELWRGEDLVDGREDSDGDDDSDSGSDGQDDELMPERAEDTCLRRIVANKVDTWKVGEDDLEGDEILAEMMVEVGEKKGGSGGAHGGEVEVEVEGDGDGELMEEVFGEGAQVEREEMEGLERPVMADDPCDPETSHNDDLSAELFGDDVVSESPAEAHQIHVFGEYTTSATRQAEKYTLDFTGPDGVARTAQKTKNATQERTEENIPSSSYPASHSPGHTRDILHPASVHHQSPLQHISKADTQSINNPNPAMHSSTQTATHPAATISVNDKSQAAASKPTPVRIDSPIPQHPTSEEPEKPITRTLRANRKRTYKALASDEQDQDQDNKSQTPSPDSPSHATPRPQKKRKRLDPDAA
ncbi:hypothetical protein Q7P37_006100 [Cladosporium fusiforme]